MPLDVFSNKVANMNNMQPLCQVAIFSDELSGPSRNMRLAAPRGRP